MDRSEQHKLACIIGCVWLLNKCYSALSGSPYKRALKERRLMASFLSFIDKIRCVLERVWYVI
jgi:hypothetical protein